MHQTVRIPELLCRATAAELERLHQLFDRVDLDALAEVFDLLTVLRQRHPRDPRSCTPLETR